MEGIASISKLAHKILKDDDNNNNKTTYWKKGILGKDSPTSNYPIWVIHHNKLSNVTYINSYICYLCFF